MTMFVMCANDSCLFILCLASHRMTPRYALCTLRSGRGEENDTVFNVKPEIAVLVD